jgi:type IV secretory pathway VirD2 relaxase
MEGIDIAETLEAWQKAGDVQFFKFIISPENADHIDLKTHATELMRQMELDLNTSLEWVAIDHHNTDHDHVHLLIRGVDAQGKPLTIEPHYIANGVRQRAQELLTRELGLRTTHDISQARERQIEKNYVTEIDRSLRYKARDGVVTYETPVPQQTLSRERRTQEIKRLKYLETLGLATQTGKKTWRLSDHLEATLREMQLSADIIKSRARHGMGALDLAEHLTPSTVTAERPIVGRVVGMGLDNELYDRRYLLIDGIDGHIHYVIASNAVVKARDAGQLKNDDVIALTAKTFTDKTDKTITYVALDNHQSVDTILTSSVSRLDTDVMQYVQEHGRRPTVEAGLSPFATQYREAMAQRFDEFLKEGVFVVRENQWELATDAWANMDDIQHRRIAPQFEKWEPIGDKTFSDKPLLGTVVASNERVFLLRDVRGTYHQIATPALGLALPRRVGSEVYVRSNRPPGLEFSNTDKRLAKFIDAQGHYDPEKHKAQLLRQQKAKPDFFLQTKDDVDSFVLAHCRRADTWVKWEILASKEGLYEAVNTRVALDTAMQTKLEAMKAEVAKQPALCTTLKAEKLIIDEKRTRWSQLDHFLKEVGLPQEDEPSVVAQRCREQAALWQSRGIGVDKDFEKVGREWLNKSSTLDKVQQRFPKVKLTTIEPVIATRYEGKIVALGCLDEKGQAHVVIERQGGLSAFPADARQRATMQVGQSIEIAVVQKNKSAAKHWEFTAARELGRSLKENDNACQ